MSRTYIFLGAVVALLFVALSSLYIVDERKQAIVLQFGQVRDVKQEPGLFFKLPFIQNVVYYEDRILPLDTEPLEVTPLDERRLVVEAFARWRIIDPVKFRLAVAGGGESVGASRLDSILNAALRGVLGNVNTRDILSSDRAAMMTEIRDAARRPAENLGVQIIDVRIKRADLPQQNLQATFARMQSEREREAADERARGAEAAQVVRATADRQAVELVSEARRDSEIIRGEADATRSAIFAEAYGRDPEFYAFYRSLAAYEQSLKGSNSTMVINPDSEFFDYLKTDRLVELPAE
ncbi:MAG: protease modulator HflC [Paracoccaceae bacterium]